jgi:hypothetical protein
VVESFLEAPAQVTVSVTGSSSKLRNLATGAVVEGNAATPGSTRRGPHGPPRTEFHIEAPPHSFVAFSEE